MYVSGEDLVIRCTIGDCDWTDREGPIELDTESVLFDLWYDHRLTAHRCESGVKPT